MQKLVEGLRRFQTDVYPGKRATFERLSEGQKPSTLFITCGDSRIVPDLILQTGPGELFICRNAGNIVPPYGELHGGVSATIEYAVVALEVENVIVCGHTLCGAMDGVLHPEHVAALPTVKSWLVHAEIARRIVRDNHTDLTGDALLERTAEENVLAQIDHLRTHPSVAVRLARGTLGIYGWMYDIKTGVVRGYDPASGSFVVVDERHNPCASPPPRHA
jgi:carbonic anhydrase